MDYKTTKEFNDNYCISCIFYDPEKECSKILDCWYSHEENDTNFRTIQDMFLFIN